MQRAQPYCGENSEPGRYIRESLTSDPELENNQDPERTPRPLAITAQTSHGEKSPTPGGRNSDSGGIRVSFRAADRYGNAERNKRTEPYERIRPLRPRKSIMPIMPAGATPASLTLRFRVTSAIPPIGDDALVD